MRASGSKKTKASMIEESFLREHEKTMIKQFLKSSNTILHISGNPGTGKTITVKYVLRNMKYTYFNCLSNTEPPVKNNLIVLDEFDKFYLLKKRDCINFLIKYKNKKIITISNNVLFHNNSLIFRPYTKDEIIYIIKKKLCDQLVDINVVEYISIREKNDFRRVLSGYKDLLLKSNGKIILTDILKKEQKKESIHQQIIHELKNLYHKQEETFTEYLIKCKELNVKSLNRADFITVYENLE